MYLDGHRDRASSHTDECSSNQTNIRSLANFYGASNHKFKAMFHMFIHRQHDHNMYVVSLQNMPMSKKVGHAGFGTTA